MYGLWDVPTIGLHGSDSGMVWLCCHIPGALSCMGSAGGACNDVGENGLACLVQACCVAAAAILVWLGCVATYHGRLLPHAWFRSGDGTLLGLAKLLDEIVCPIRHINTVL
jgi:hypothetical protein